MIKIEDVVTPSPEQMLFVISGMRNPLNSWSRGDSMAIIDGNYATVSGDIGIAPADDPDGFTLGKNDEDLMRRLANAGTEHRKFMRMMPVYVRITAPLYWWKEADCYCVGVVKNSCSTMHKIAAKEFTLDDFSCEHLLTDEPIPCRDYSALGMMNATIYNLNKFRDLYLQTKDKKYWWQMIQLLPSSYNQTRNVMMNYEVLANIYRQRKDHKLDCWREFCKWIKTLPYSELITGEENERTMERN